MNPYDNASCEIFIKTLKREEIYANEYENLEHLRDNIQEFVEWYCNQKQLRSALGYHSPQEFEQQANKMIPKNDRCCYVYQSRIVSGDGFTPSSCRQNCGAESTRLQQNSLSTQ